MAKFAIGEKVDNAADGHEGGLVIAVFQTIDGNVRGIFDFRVHFTPSIICHLLPTAISD